MSILKMYYRVYQDRESISRFYVDTLDNVLGSLEAWRETCEEEDCTFPVIEPVLMSQKDFENLEDFEGY